jgi:hypothetical protein
MFPFVGSFGRASALLEGEKVRLELAWLAGLLEAEGTFLRPAPSGRRLPIVACQMTDADVVDRVASDFGTKSATVPRPGRRCVYAAKLKGSRAAALMIDLAPLMGARRTRAIAEALSAYSPPDRKLDYLAAEEIRDLRALGASVSWLARSFCVARSTIRQVLAEAILFEPPVTPWRAQESIAGVTDPANVSLPEVWWLAGWLEGEGSFLAPPPSDPKRPRVSGVTRDRDVAAEVGRLLGVTPTRSYDRRARRRGWSPTWHVLGRGRPALAWMAALYPLMGTRRRQQIDAARSGFELPT